MNAAPVRDIAVLGAGPMGLAAALRLAQRGHKVTVYEADDRIGGMSAAFDFDGLTIERYYHFICATDQPLFRWLDELGIAGALRWTDTRMGFFYEGTLYEWGRPDRLLAFPHLDMVSKLRYAAHVMHTKSISDWRALDKVECTGWLKRWTGERAYDVLMRSLFELKFYEHAESLSAAWLGTRIKRVALSRKNLFQERMGYLEGGSETFLAALKRRLDELGVTIRLKAPVREVVAADGAVTGVRTPDGDVTHDRVVSTIPIQYLPRMVPALPTAERAKIEAIENIAVACVIVKLKHPISPYFWMNINDRGMVIPGVIEYSNLNDVGAHILYAPYYMPKTNPLYGRPDAEFFKELRGYMARLNPAFRDDWVLAEKVSRYEFAQTVCTPNFFDKLPPMASGLGGFYMADTSYYYPEDRSISESIQVGERLAEAVR